MGGTIHALTPGTILDNRYRLDSVLGQGGFGITYAAVNIRVDLRVAIKELFWKGHSSRNAAVSPEVALEDERDAGQFAAQKKRFLEEAKAIRDFSGLPGIVRILDYFEENGTAYLVMEYAEGETLSAKIIREGPMPAEEIFRSFLPLMDSLAHVHRAGVIHRDISPDNIIVKPDGTLELIDFGAARQYLSVGEKGITSIAKDSYAPGEQYDRNGKQGPWTDIYSLCATLYTCTTGVTPPNAVQRMFLDELRKPTEAGASMEPAYEAVILKGLQLNASRRWQSMEEMAEAVRKVLPERTLPAVSSRKSVFRGVLAGILVAVLAIGIWTFVRNDRADRFGGKETVQVLVTPPNGMTTKEYDAARAVLIGRMEDFAGKDGYLLETESTNMLFTLPLETFGGTGIDEALQKVVRGQENEPDFRYQAEIVGCWEDPGTSATRGKNQVQPAELKGRTGIFVFTGFNELSPGERTNLYMDMKTRLDALGVPYAFGTEYGHDERIVFRMGMERLGPFVLHSIGSDQMRVVGELSGGGLSVSRNSFRANVEVSEEDGRCSLVLVSDSNYVTQQLEKRTAWLLSTGGNTLYLEAPSGHDALAETSFDAPITDGRIVFSRFRTAEPQEITAENRWIADYVAAVTTETRLPGTCSLEKSGAVREDGRTDFSGIKEDEFGLKLTMKKGEAELDRELRRYAAEKGYGYKKDYDSYFVGLNLTMDEGFTERAGAAVSEMAGRLHLDTAILNMPLRILLIGEEAYEFCRITIQTKYDIIFDSEDYGMEIYNWMDNSIGGSERMKAYRETFNTWWEQYPVEALGFSRSVFEDTRKEQ